MTKNMFLNKLNEMNIKIGHLSERQLDYKYLEYKLYLILSKYQNDDFIILGLPDNLSIVKDPRDTDYNIYRRSHVTLNAELYRLFDSGYFSNLEEFIRYVTIVITKYKNGTATIKTLVSVIRSTRVEYEKETWFEY